MLTTTDKLAALVDDIVESDPPSAELAEPMFKALRVLSASPTLDELDQQRHEQRED